MFSARDAAFMTEQELRELYYTNTEVLLEHESFKLQMAESAQHLLTRLQVCVIVLIMAVYMVFVELVVKPNVEAEMDEKVEEFNLSVICKFPYVKDNAIYCL